MFYDPKSYLDYQKLLEIMSLTDLDISDNTLECLSLIANEKNSGSWFQYDFSKEPPKIYPLEEFENVDEIKKEFPGNGAWLNFQLDKNLDQLILDHFKSLISLVFSLKGFRTLQISSIHDLLISPHVDYEDTTNFFRCVLTFECPTNQTLDVFGLEVNGVKSTINKNDIHIFDGSILHSAWNHTSDKWKFIIIDIDKGFFNLV